METLHRVPSPSGSPSTPGYTHFLRATAEAEFPELTEGLGPRPASPASLRPHCVSARQALGSQGHQGAQPGEKGQLANLFNNNKKTNLVCFFFFFKHLHVTTLVNTLFKTQIKT